MAEGAAAAGGAGRHLLAGMPAGWALAVLLALLIAEVLAVPGVVLPGGTAVVLVGALVGSGRADGRLAVPAVTVAVLLADQVAFWAGGRAGRWLRRRVPAARARSAGQPARPAARWRHLGLAALPSLAGATQLPYRRFVVREVALRAAWLPVFLIAGEIGGRSLSRVRTLGTGAAVVAGVVVAAVLLARRRRLLARWLTASRVETALLVLLVVAGASTCAAVLQDLLAHDELARADQRVATLAAAYLHGGLHTTAVAVSRFVRPPGLFVTAGMAVSLLDLLRRGRSTLRFALVALSAVGGDGLLDVAFRRAGVPEVSSAGLALVTGLAVSLTFTAGHRGPPVLTALIGAAGVAAAALAGGCLIATGLPVTAAAVGAGWGVICGAITELGPRQAPTTLRHLLSDNPPNTPHHQPSPPRTPSDPAARN